MKNIDPRHYDIIVAPVVTEKATLVKVKSVNTLVRKGKTKVFRGNFGSQSDVKRAIVTLEEGHRIDVTTGL
jgi:large subunit ribosomal protein L23